MYSWDRESKMAAKITNARPIAGAQPPPQAYEFDYAHMISRPNHRHLPLLVITIGRWRGLWETGNYLTYTAPQFLFLGVRPLDDISAHGYFADLGV